MRRAIVIGVLALVTAWNAVSLYGSLYPFVHAYYPGPWVALREHRAAFVAFDAALAVGVALALAGIVLYVRRRPGAFAVTAAGLALAAVKGFANTYLVRRFVGATTPSIAGGVLSLAALFVLAAIGRDGGRAGEGDGPAGAAAGDTDGSGAAGGD